MKKSEKQDLQNEIERLHKKIEQEEKLNFSRTAQITSLQRELDTRDKACRELCARLEEKEKQIEELESELRVKEDLFTIKGAISEEQPSSEWYEQRYQSDCIRINQQNVTIDVLVEKLARLREVKGL